MLCVLQYNLVYIYCIRTYNEDEVGAECLFVCLFSPKPLNRLKCDFRQNLRYILKRGFKNFNP